MFGGAALLSLSFLVGVTVLCGRCLAVRDTMNRQLTSVLEHHGEDTLSQHIGLAFCVRHGASKCECRFRCFVVVTPPQLRMRWHLQLHLSCISAERQQCEGKLRCSAVLFHA